MAYEVERLSDGARESVSTDKVKLYVNHPKWMELVKPVSVGDPSYEECEHNDPCDSVFVHPDLVKGLSQEQIDLIFGVGKKPDIDGTIGYSAELAEVVVLLMVSPTVIIWMWTLLQMLVLVRLLCLRKSVLMMVMIVVVLIDICPRLEI